MQKYEIATAIQQRNKNIVNVSVSQAFNIAFGKLIIVSITAFLFYVITLWLFGVNLLMPLLIAACFYAAYQFGSRLVEYTEEDRRQMYQQIQYIEEEIESEEETSPQSAMFPRVEGNGFYMISVALTASQILAIARTGIQKGSLPVNYLESLGLSRQNAEKLRIELGQRGLAHGNKCHITKTGKASFQKLLDIKT